MYSWRDNPELHCLSHNSRHDLIKTILYKQHWPVIEKELNLQYFNYKTVQTDKVNN